MLDSKHNILYDQLSNNPIIGLRSRIEPIWIFEMSLSSPVRAETLSIQVARQIESLITSGAWPVGTRIPPEKDLVNRLLVSRNAIREALRSLVHTGMLEARAGDGTLCARAERTCDPLSRRVKRGNLAEAVEVRAGLERQAARFAAERRTTAEVARMRELLRRSCRSAVAKQDRAAYTDADGNCIEQPLDVRATYC